MVFHALKQKVKGILVWSQKYTRTDMVYLARGGFWLLNEQIIVSFGLFVIAIFFARYVPKEIYGTYKFVLSLWGIINALSLTGMNGAVTQAVANGYEKTFNRALTIQIKWGWMITAIGFACAAYYLFQNNLVLAIACVIFSTFTPFINVANTFTAYLNGKKEFKKLAIYNTIVVLGTNAAPLILVLIFPGAIAPILGYFVFAALLNVFFLKYTIKKIPPRGENDESFIRYGKHLSLIYIISILSINIDKVLIFHFFGATQLAVYCFALVIPDQLRGLFKIVSSVSLPKLSVKNESEIKHHLPRRLFLIFSGSLIIMGVYYLFAPLLFYIFFPQYQEAVYFSRLFAIATIFGGMVVFITAIMQTQMSRLINFYKFNLLSSLFRSAVLLAGIYFYGIIGAIGATLLYYLFSIFYGLALIYRKPLHPTPDNQLDSLPQLDNT
jgi:O-antigen/teichoic acid export membrane protein